MTIRDVANDFGYKPPTASSIEVCEASIVGAPGPYIAPNSLDSGPYGAFLSELTALDTILTVGGMNFFVESGVGQGMKLCVDWVQAPQGSGTIDVQLITSASGALSNPVVMLDFTALPVSTYFAGYRQIQALPRSSKWLRFISLQVITTGTMTQGAYIAWVGLDVDSEMLGYADGFSIK